MVFHLRGFIKILANAKPRRIPSSFELGFDVVAVEPGVLRQRGGRCRGQARVALLLIGAVGEMVHYAVSARALLASRRARLARVLVPEQRRLHVARIRMLETF